MKACETMVCNKNEKDEKRRISIIYNCWYIYLNVKISKRSNSIKVGIEPRKYSGV